MKKRRSKPWLACLLAAFTSPAHGQDVDSFWKNLMLDGQHAAIGLDLPKAEQIYQRALKEAERYGPADPRVASTLRNLGSVYQSGKKFTEAEASYRRAIAILDKGDGDDSSDLADLNLNLGIVLTSEGKSAEALVVLRRSLGAIVKRAGGDSLQSAAVHCAIGEAQRTLRAWPEAATSLKRCADIREADGGVMNAAFGDAVYSLALVYEKQGRFALADPRFRIAEKIRESTQGIMSPGFAEVLESHAAMLKTMGRDKEAARDAILAAAIRHHQSKK